MKINQVLTMAAVLAVTCGTLLAADNYKIPELEDKTNWMAWVFAVVFALGVCVIGFKNSRRTHLD